MSCQRCGSDRVLSVGGKSSDCNSYQFGGVEREGYLPRVTGLCGGDYYELDACLECGQLQGVWPQPTPEELLPETCCECDTVLNDRFACPNPECCEWAGLSPDDEEDEED